MKTSVLLSLLAFVCVLTSCQKRGGDNDTLIFHGSDSIGKSLTPDLVKAWLKSKGYKRIAVDKQQDNTFLEAQNEQEDILKVDIICLGSNAVFRGSSEEGKIGLAGRYCDIGMSSRKISEGERDYLSSLKIADFKESGREVPLAKDELLIIKHPQNPVEEISIEDLAKIYSGEIKNWETLGGPDLEIIPLSRNRESGTHHFFLSETLPYRNQPIAQGIAICDQNESMHASVAAELGAIGYLSKAFISEEVSPLTLKKEGLPYTPTRTFYYYIPENKKMIVREFMSFLHTKKCREIIKEHNLSPH